MAIDFNSLQDLGLALNNPGVQTKKELGQEAFLELMTTQLKNQDPLKPMESGDFLGQIAQFGTVSGIQDLQKSFSDFATSITSEQALQAATLVNRSVLVDGDEAVLAAGGTLAGELNLPVSAASVGLSIFDSNGELVRRLDLGNQAAGLVPFSWDGLMEDGTYANPGVYRIEGSASSDGVSFSLDSQVRAQVDSVTLGKAGEGLKINLSGLGTVDFSKVQQIL